MKRASIWVYGLKQHMFVSSVSFVSCYTSNSSSSCLPRFLRLSLASFYSFPLGKDWSPLKYRNGYVFLRHTSSPWISRESSLTPPDPIGSSSFFFPRIHPFSHHSFFSQTLPRSRRSSISRRWRPGSCQGEESHQQPGMHCPNSLILIISIERVSSLVLQL